MNPRIVNVTSCALNSCLSLPKPKPMLMFLAPHSCFSSSSNGRPSFSILHSNLSPSRRYLTLPLTKSGRALMFQPFISPKNHQGNLTRSTPTVATAFSSSQASSFAFHATDMKIEPMYEVGELFELGIQLSYLLLLLALLGAGSFFVIRQVLVRRELDLSAKELQEQVRSGDASATELFELGAVMLRRKYYPASTKFLLQAIDKWDGDEQDLAQVYNALGVSYVRDGKLEKGIAQFEKAVKIQPGYVTAWNNLGDAYEQQKDMKSALKAFEEVLLFDPNNKVARPRVDSLRELVNMYKGVPKGVPVKSKDRN